MQNRHNNLMTDKSVEAQNNQIGSNLGMKLLAFTMRFAPQIAYAFALFPVLWYYIAKPQGRRAAAVLFDRLEMTGGFYSRFVFGFKQAFAFSRIILDNIYLGVFGKKDFVIEEKGIDTLLDQLKKGKGLILLSAHMGNWHLAVNFLSNTNTKVHLVTDEMRQEEVRRQMDLAKKVSNHLTVHNAQQGAELVFELSAALKRNEVVIIAGDRTGKGGRRMDISFLGKRATFPTAALALADTTGTPVCAALTFREKVRSYTCYGIGPLTTSERLDKNERIKTMLTEFAGELETYIRRYPTQWFNFYDFWQ